MSLARIQTAIDAKKLDAKETVTAEALVKAGVIRRAKDGVRLLSDGELKAKLAFDVAGASKAAIEKIEKAGGSVKLPERQLHGIAEVTAFQCWRPRRRGRLHLWHAGAYLVASVTRAA